MGRNWTLAIKECVSTRYETSDKLRQIWWSGNVWILRDGEQKTIPALFHAPQIAQTDFVILLVTPKKC